MLEIDRNVLGVLRGTMRYPDNKELDFFTNKVTWSSTVSPFRMILMPEFYSIGVSAKSP